MSDYDEEPIVGEMYLCDVDLSKMWDPDWLIHDRKMGSFSKDEFYKHKIVTVIDVDLAETFAAAWLRDMKIIVDGKTVILSVRNWHRLAGLGVLKKI